MFDNTNRSVEIQIIINYDLDYMFICASHDIATVTRGLRIIREGNDYYLIHQGEIQRHLGSRRQKIGQTSFLPLSSKREFLSEGLLEEDKSCRGILDRILFFIGDLEVASTDAKRSRAL